MPKSAPPPENCQTMAHVRAGVDATDRALVELLATRFGYMDAAARIKPKRSDVRDEARKTAVIEAVRSDAAARGLPADVMADMWEQLVEASIAHELAEWERLRD